MPPGAALAVVEGNSDKQMLSSLLHRSTVTVSSRGKEIVLDSRQYLRPDERDRMLFVIDCDGSVDQSWLTDGDVVVSSLRDLDADLAYVLGTLENVVWDFVAGTELSGAEAVVQTQEILNGIDQLSTRFGIVLSAARSVNAGVRVIERKRKRRLKLTDLADLAVWSSRHIAPELDELIHIVAGRLNWDDHNIEAVESQIEQGASKECRAHAKTRCAPCATRTYSNGHDIADALSVYLTQLAETEIGSAEAARLIRLARRKGSIEDWSVVQRIRVRENAIGIQLLA